MPERTDWEAKARGLLRAEMAKHGLTYSRLVEKLKPSALVKTSETYGTRSVAVNSRLHFCFNACPPWKRIHCI